MGKFIFSHFVVLPTMTDLQVGKLQAALASATNEVTVAAASLNFDFSLVKVEAPPEFQPLKAALSPKRQTEAEFGQTHLTARRLGALFDGLCPCTPKLIKAYGNRVSEISVEASANLPSQSNWIFSAYTGIDATSIWAAATSSNAAIHVHLLACFLARIWDRAEAISVWVEIVEERRREIASKFDQGDNISFGLCSASQQEIARDQLASWDANARAWLQTADAVKVKQQTQLLLIIKNISIPVNSESRLYQSVIKAWVSALNTMEKMISGAPHAVQDGTILVALSAWHLYPDISVFGKLGSKKDVLVGDHLVQEGGILSLGLHTGTSDSEGTLRHDVGVHWSLPLRHYRFYGAPVRKTRILQNDGSRLLFSELLQANLGVLLSQWSVPPYDSTTGEALCIMNDLVRLLPKTRISSSVWNRDNWTEMISQPIMSYFNDPDHGSYLLSLGRRRPMFHKIDPGRAFFGLIDLSTTLAVLKDSDARVKLLRHLAHHWNVPQQYEMIIVYFDKVHGSSTLTTRNDAEYTSHESLSRQQHSHWHSYGRHLTQDDNIEPQYATARVHSSQDDATGDVQNHCRWVCNAATYRSLPEEKVMPQTSRVFYYDGTGLSIPGERKVLDFLYGVPTLAAVYLERRAYELGNKEYEIPLADLRWCFQNDLIDPESLKRHILKVGMDTIKVLQYLSIASIFYSVGSMKGASIPSNILDYPFDPNRQMREIVESKSTRPNNGLFTRFLALSTMAYMECGQDISRRVNQEDLRHVLGLSTGDSIYVPTEVICPTIPKLLLFRN